MTFRSSSLGNSLRPYLCLVTLGLSAAARPLCGQAERKVTKLADGVYEIEHKNLRLGVQSSNTTVIIGDRQVFVVDAGFMPSVAREDIAQIRQWTDKPVTFVLTTHFHNDHNFANRAYVDAFPAVTFIATVERRKIWTAMGRRRSCGRNRATSRINRRWTAERTVTARR